MPEEPQRSVIKTDEQLGDRYEIKIAKFKG